MQRRLRCVLSQDHLIVDLMNEPDAYGATWTDGGTLPEDVATYYLDAMDALYPLCPGCLFQIQGCGESVRLPLLAMGLCEHDASVGVVRERHASAIPFPSPFPLLFLLENVQAHVQRRMTK